MNLRRSDSDEGLLGRRDDPGAPGERNGATAGPGATAGRGDAEATLDHVTTPRESFSTLPGLLAAVLAGDLSGPDQEELPGALRWVAASADPPTARSAQRLADELTEGDDLAGALRRLAASGDEGARWAAAAVELHGELGGDLPEILRTAERTAAERAVVAEEQATLRWEARLIVGALTAQPVAMAGLGALMSTGVGSVGLALLAVATLLTVGGVWWLVRVTRPPFDWRPFRRRPEGGPPDDDGLLDGAALASAAGLDLDAAVRWAAHDRSPDAVDRLVEALRRQPGAPGRSGPTAEPDAAGENGDGDRTDAAGEDGDGDRPDVTTGFLQDEATHLRGRQVAATRAATHRIRWLAAVPYVVCLLPASILFIVALV